MWTYLSAFEYCGNICKRFFASDIGNLIQCSYLTRIFNRYLRHLLLCLFTRPFNIALYPLEKNCWNYKLYHCWGTCTWKSLFKLWNSTCLRHFNSKKVVCSMKFNISRAFPPDKSLFTLSISTLALEKNCLNYEIQLTWSTCIWKNKFTLWNWISPKFP